MKLILLLSLLCCLLSSCVVKSPYPDFYKQQIPITDDLVLNYENTPEITYTDINSFRSRVLDFIEKGFVVLGEAHFSAGQLLVGDDYAIQHGKKIGATHILLARQFESSHSGNLQLTTPTQDITYHSGNVNVYGNNGSHG